MLLSFRFANHRSFRDDQQLNLLRVYDGDGGSPFDAVRIAGIFGANASGKSNVIKAFTYLSTAVGKSDQASEPGRGPNRRPFRLDPAAAALPSHYEVDLLINGVRHTYGFSVDDDQILEEWLYTYPLRKKRVVFERAGQKFRWGDEASRSSLRKLADIVIPPRSALFMSVAARLETQRAGDRERDETTAAIHDTFVWLWQRVSQNRHEIRRHEHRESLYSLWLADSAIRSAAVDLLKAADIGLRDVFIETSEKSLGKVNFVHQGAADNVSFSVGDESSGTLRLLELAAGAIPVLENGGLFLVDEIDASMHPLLTATFIQLFQSPTVNKRRAQLLFTTNDATLLGSIDGDDVLERDQVWFTAKGDDGASELFSLAEFKPRRQDENRQKRYLNGSYGAIPEISVRMFQQALSSRTESDDE
jgi:uncharacterized protein